MKRLTHSFTKEWVESIPKLINDNGCWIPQIYYRGKDGYAKVSFGKKTLMLHRVVICTYLNLSYYNDFESRHNNNCSKDCFNPNHLSIGTHTDNMRDKIRDGTHHNINKKVCPKCNRPYSSKIIRRSGPRKGQIFRKCNYCANEKRRKKK